MPSLAPEVEEGLLALGDLAEIIRTVVGSFPAGATGSPTFPGSSTLPGVYPGTWASGDAFAPIYPSTPIDIGPRMAVMTESLEALAPLLEV